MKYIGLHQQIKQNNVKSALLLLGFPLLILATVYAFIFFKNAAETDASNHDFIAYIPWVSIAVVIWFLIAFASHSAMINRAAKSKSLDRKNHMRVYNLTENLCISAGMQMPKLRIIDSSALNAFASGINEKTYTVTLTKGIIESLDDKELEGVIAHELSHIRNKDVRLLIVSIIFVGIFSFALEVVLRTFLRNSGNRSSKNKTDGRVLIIALLITLIAYLISMVFRFALSRKREYLADAGAVELTKDPLAMASALRKISGNHVLEVKVDEIKQSFIENSNQSKSAFSGIKGIFATHPPIEKRIAFLEQM